MYVVDASVYAPLVAVCGRSLIRAMERHGFAILDLTVYETCNAFWKEHIKLHRIDRGSAVQACRVAKALTQYTRLYRVTDLDTEEVMRMAMENNITFYDASYITLASMLKVPIATEDRDILRVAPSYGLGTVRLRDLMERSGLCR